MGKTHLFLIKYLTDDNPRFENSSKIRRDIKRIKQKKVLEIPNEPKQLKKQLRA